MSHCRKHFSDSRLLLAAAANLIALASGGGRCLAQMPEIDSYELAVRSQTKADALAFIETFHSSHLVGDLIESLSPEIAQQVCADLRGGGPERARRACAALQEAPFAHITVYFSRGGAELSAD